MVLVIPILCSSAYLSAVGGCEVVVSPVELGLALFAPAGLQSHHAQGPSGNITFRSMLDGNI